MNSSGTNLDTALTFDPETCPYCAKSMGNDSEGMDGNETADSDSEGVYEFTQDAHYRDSRDPNRKKKFALGARAAKVVRFWRLVCDTFRKIVDSKYFGRGIMIAILINTLSMGIEYHEQVSARLYDVLTDLISGNPHLQDKIVFCIRVKKQKKTNQKTEKVIFPPNCHFNGK